MEASLVVPLCVMILTFLLSLTFYVYLRCWYTQAACEVSVQGSGYGVLEGRTGQEKQRKMENKRSESGFSGKGISGEITGNQKEVRVKITGKVSVWGRPHLEFETKIRTKNHTTSYICEKSDCVSYIKRRFLEMKMDYRRDLQHNYLVVETGEKTENYITRMMTENQVQGLLGCECRRMDQKKLYYYDITSKISLAEKSRLKKVKGSEVLLIIQGLLQVLVQLEEYLIPADQICLDWNYIYLDPVSCYPSFCCLPAAEKKLEQGIRELLEELLPRLDHQEQTGVSVVYELYQYAIQDTFSVMGLQSVLERRLMEERKTTETELQACQEKKSREHQETSYFGDNRQAVLEDFFSSEEEEGENGRVSPVLVGMVLGIIGVLLYALAGYAVLEYVPQYLGTWAASGVMAVLIVLIWQVVVRKRKKRRTTD